MKSKNKSIVIVAISISLLLLLCCCITTLVIVPSFFSSSPKTQNPEIPIIRNIDITDTFDDNKYSWQVGSSDAEFGKNSRTITNGKYLWSLESKSETGSLVIGNAKIEQSQSMITSIDVNQISAPETGEYKLIFMYKDESNYYSFKINQYYQQYSIGMVKNGKWTEWVDWTRDAVINWDKTNNMKITSEDGLHTFYINGVKVFQKTDTTFTSGGSCLAVQLYGNGEKGNWEFDNYIYKKLK
jgi:heme/copper-type cytochrome/quinol oxidase subunit 2